jgi:hypothetical protein
VSFSAQREWAAVAGMLSCASGACEPVTTSVGAFSPDPNQYIEAERGELFGGFTIGSDPLASEARFIEPPAGVASDAEPGLARASYAFRVRAAGDYAIWGRLRSPGALNNRFWFRVDGGAWTKWRISVGDIWYWDDFHDDAQYGTPLVFSFSAGAHELVIANCVDGVELDRLYFSVTGDEPPGNETPCDPPHSIELEGRCLPSCGAQNGTTCDAVRCEGRELIDAYDCGVCCHVEP